MNEGQKVLHQSWLAWNEINETEPIEFDRFEGFVKNRSWNDPCGRLAYEIRAFYEGFYEGINHEESYTEPDLIFKEG